MKSILLCAAFIAFYATASHAMEKENQEKGTHFLPGKLDEEKLKKFLKANIKKVVQKHMLVYKDGESKWALKCSMNFFEEGRLHNKGSLLPDIISSTDIIFYPLISARDAAGVQVSLNIRNFLVAVQKDKKILLHLIMDKIN